MLDFLESEKRDFIPSIDITIQDFAGQGKLTLSALINYKTSWQNGALKAQRRNKWICALKIAMAELQIFGPGDAGNPARTPSFSSSSPVFQPFLLVVRSLANRISAYLQLHRPVQLSTLSFRTKN